MAASLTCITRWAIPPKFISGKIGGIALSSWPEGRPHALVINAGCDRPQPPILFGDEHAVTGSMFGNMSRSLKIVEGDNINAGRIDALDVEAPGEHGDELDIVVMSPTDAPDDMPVKVKLKPRVLAWPFDDSGV